ncbi:MAG: methyl-accepting chemotaxis protein [Pseudomonadota bacterium]
MSLLSLCRRLSDLLDRMVSNARSVNAASRSRADLAAGLLSDASAAHGRLSGLSGCHGELKDYLDGASTRIDHLTDIASPLAVRIDEMNSHVDALLEEEAALQTVLTTVTGHAKSVADIAQLARLLSINAAVEAARSGEAGLGFAVVAREMRTLSDQTTQRADDIDGLVDMLMDRLGRMRERVVETKTPLDHLSATVEDVLSSLTNSRTLAVGASETATMAHAAIADEVEGLKDLMDRLSRLQTDTEAAIAGSADNAEIGAEARKLADRIARDVAARDLGRAA